MKTGLSNLRIKRGDRLLLKLNPNQDNQQTTLKAKLSQFGA